MNENLKYYVLTDNILISTPFTKKYPLKIEKIFEKTDSILKARFCYDNGLIVDIDSNPTITLIRSNYPITKSNDGTFSFII